MLESHKIGFNPSCITGAKSVAQAIDGTTTLNVYRYNHNPMELYEANANQPAFDLEGYEAPYPEQALYKGIPMMYRWNPTIRNMMRTGNFRIRYRGTSKPQYGYKRLPNHTLAEYADTFAIFPRKKYFKKALDLYTIY